MTEPTETEQTTVYRDPLNIIVPFGGTTTYVDSSGAPRTVVGSQPDGTITVADSNAPAPPSPTTPTVAGIFAGLAVTWDGSLSAALPIDFDHVEVHVSNTSGFTPSGSTLYGSLRKKGTLQAAPLIVGTTYYVILIAVNTSGAQSVASTQVSGVPNGISSSDVSFNARDIGGVTSTISATAPTPAIAGDIWIDSAHGFSVNRYNGSAWVAVQFGTQAIQASSITSALIAASTIVAGNMAAGSISTGALQANAVTADKLAATLILASTIIAGTASGARLQLDSSGLNAYDGVNPDPTVQISSLGHAIFNGSSVTASELVTTIAEIDAGSYGGLVMYGTTGSPVNANSAFSSGIANWSADPANPGLSLSYSATQQYSGHNTLRIVGGGGGGPVYADSELFTVVPGDTYTVRVVAFCESGMDIQAILQLTDSAGTNVLATGAQFLPTPRGQFQTLSFTVKDDSGSAVKGRIKLAVSGGTNAVYVGYAGASLNDPTIQASIAPQAGYDGQGNTFPAGMYFGGQAIPYGTIAYAINASDSATTSGSSSVDYSGVTVTPAMKAGRRYKITASFDGVQSTAAGDIVRVMIRDGVGNVLKNSYEYVGAANKGLGGKTISFIDVPGAGSKTYKVSYLRNAGSGTVFVNGPCFILVEDIGT